MAKNNMTADEIIKIAMSNMSNINCNSKKITAEDRENIKRRQENPEYWQKVDELKNKMIKEIFC